VYGYLLKGTNKDDAKEITMIWTYFWLEYAGDFEYAYYIVDPETVGRFVGEKDKSNKEIYEGDVVIGNTSFERDIDERIWSRENSAIVEWDDKVCGFYPFYLNSRWRCDVKDIEIIGNIHDNPELLKEMNNES